MVICYISAPVLSFAPLLLKGTRNYELKKTYDVVEQMVVKLSRTHRPSLWPLSNP